MKLAFPHIQNAIKITEDFVTGLVVENPALLFSLLQDLRRQTNGEAGRAILSEDNTPVSMPKHLELLTDFISFDGNSKGLQTKIIQRLERTAQNENFVSETNRILSLLEAFLDDLAYYEDLELAYDKLSLTNLLKSVGIRPIMDYNTLEERLYAYMDLVTRLEGDKLFVLVNLRSFVPTDALDAFSETVTAHGMKVLLVDGHDYPTLSAEKRFLIDEDLCEV